MDKCVVNLSSRELNQHEKEVLALGLNFALTPPSVQVSDIVAQVEQGLSKAKPDNPNTIRTNIRQIFQRCNETTTQPDKGRTHCRQDAKKGL